MKSRNYPTELRLLAKELDSTNPDGARLIRESAVEIERLKAKLS